MTTTHPEQLMLPGQTAAPDGPIDMVMMYVMHHGFRRDLDRFAAAAPVTPVDDRDAWAALAERWQRFSEILHEHHSGEDAGVWPYLLELADDDERQTLHDMEAEHAQIDPLLARCERSFAVMAGGSPLPAGHDRHTARSALAVQLAEARELLARHLRHEETEAIAILQRVTTPEDWKRIEDEHFQPKQSPRFLLYAVSWVAEALPEDALDRAFAEAGQGFRVVRWLGRGRFRRLERRAFRHLPA